MTVTFTKKCSRENDTFRLHAIVAKLTNFERTKKKIQFNLAARSTRNKEITVPHGGDYRSTLP